MGPDMRGRAGDELGGSRLASDAAVNEAAGTKVTVLFFAGAREAAGTRRAEFSSLTVAGLIEQLRSAYGRELEALLPACAVWVNGSPAAPATELREGDEVAVLPPVSGG